MTTNNVETLPTTQKPQTTREVIQANVDLLVTVDSAVAHLAAAMGRQVAMLVPNPADWRWGTGSTSSPWYPTMRLHRQRTPGDWSGTIAELAASLG